MIKGLTLGTVNETLENDRTIADSGERARRDRQVVPHEIEFRDSRLCRKIQFVRMSYADFMPCNREHLAGFLLVHKDRLTPRRALIRLAREQSKSAQQDCSGRHVLALSGVSNHKEPKGEHEPL